MLLISAAGGSLAGDTYAKTNYFKIFDAICSVKHTGGIDSPGKMDNDQVIVKVVLSCVVGMDEVEIADQVDTAHFGVVGDVQSSQQDVNCCVTF